MHWLCPKCRAGFEERRDRCPADSARLIQNLSGRIYGGRWSIERLLGVGGGGATVWSAVGLQTMRPVALKLAPVHDLAEVRRFERGARISGMLEHPHITQVVEHGRDGEHVMLVMEQLEGETLKRRLSRQRIMSPSEAAHVASQILDALDFAHHHGVVHRDIKLSNLFITPTTGDPLFIKILDWGISKFVDGKEPEGLREASEAEDVAVTQAQQILGTPEYMAPEQIIGGAADVRSDIYAMGIVLYMLLTGKHPFEAKTRAEMYHSHLMKEVPSLPAAIGSRLDAVVRQALAKRPEDRWATAAAMRRGLNAVMHAAEPSLPGLGGVTGMGTRPSMAFGAGLAGKAPESDVTTTENVQTAGVALPAAPSKSRKKVLVIAALGSMAAVATILAIALPGGSTAEATPQEVAQAPKPGVKVPASEDNLKGLELGAVPNFQLAGPGEVPTREPAELDAVAAGADGQSTEAAKAAASAKAAREAKAESARNEARKTVVASAPASAIPGTKPMTEVAAPTPSITPAQTATTTPSAPPVMAAVTPQVAASVTQPVAPIARPVAPIAQPVAPIAQPVAPVAVAAPVAVTPQAPTDAATVVPKPTGNEVLPFTAGMSRPVRIAGGDPRYTNQALAAKVSGTMVVRCIIELDGSLSACKVLKPVAHMEQATLDALAGHRYRPIMFEGRPRRVSYVFNFNFVSPK